MFTDEELEIVEHSVNTSERRLNEVLYQSGKPFTKEQVKHMEKRLISYNELLEKVRKM